MHTLNTKLYTKESRILTATQILSLAARRRRKNSRRLLQLQLLIRHKPQLGSSSSSLCKAKINNNSLYLLKIGRTSNKMLVATNRTSSNSRFLHRIINSKGSYTISSKLRIYRLLNTIIGLIRNQECKIKALTTSNSNILSLAKKRGIVRGRSKMVSLVQKNTNTCQLMISTTILKTKILKILIQTESIWLEVLHKGIPTRELLVKLKRRMPRIRTEAACQLKIKRARGMKSTSWKTLSSNRTLLKMNSRI